MDETVPPGTYSMNILKCCCPSQCSPRHFTIFGWSSRCIIAISRRRRSSCAGFMDPGAMVSSLTARILFVSRSIARKTSPNVPLPSNSFFPNEICRGLLPAPQEAGRLGMAGMVDSVSGSDGSSCRAGGVVVPLRGAGSGGSSNSESLLYDALGDGPRAALFAGAAGFLGLGSWLDRISSSTMTLSSRSSSTRFFGVACSDPPDESTVRLAPHRPRTVRRLAERLVAGVVLGL